MSKYSLRSVLEWLRAGYPEGIPVKDHFAILAVLRRRLTPEEIEEVVELSTATSQEHPERQIDYTHIRNLISGVTHEEPTDEDLARVTERLAAGGWPVAHDEENPRDLE